MSNSISRKIRILEKIHSKKTVMDKDTQQSRVEELAIQKYPVKIIEYDLHGSLCSEDENKKLREAFKAGYSSQSDAVEFSKWKDNNFNRFAKLNQYYRIEDGNKEISEITYYTREELYNIFNPLSSPSQSREQDAGGLQKLYDEIQDDHGHACTARDSVGRDSVLGAGYAATAGTDFKWMKRITELLSSPSKREGVKSADEIYEKHTGTNMELQYIPTPKENVLAAMYEYKNQSESTREGELQWVKCKGNYPSKNGPVAGRLKDTSTIEYYNYFEYYFTGDKNQWDRNYPFGEYLSESSPKREGGEQNKNYE